MDRTTSAASNRSSTPAVQALQDHNSVASSSVRGSYTVLQDSSRGTHRHLPYPFTAQQLTPVVPNTTAQTTAWVLSSPSGPQALVFAPGHGYFASPSTHTSARLAPSRSTRLRPTNRTQTAGTAVRTPQSTPH